MVKSKGSGENHEENQNSKQLKSSHTFWSPLNDNYTLPNRASKCTWHKEGDSNSSPHTHKDWKRTSKILPNILSAIGNTPLIKLNKIPQSAGIKCNVYVKCEFMNPGGSVKDRIGFRIIEDAEQQGVLKPGSTIIEPSSGNTGIGMALAAAVKGYRCIIVMSEKMSNEKVAVLNALGVEAVRTPVNADSASPEGMFGTSTRLRKEIPNSVILDQYTNPGNPLAHYDTTAEEILDQCDRKVDMVVVGSGTGGTICGIGRKFKEVSPTTKVIGVDPEGSSLAQPEELNKTDVSFYEVEGIGYDFIPTVLDRSVVDMWIKTNDKEALPMARRLIREEGLLCGSSSGSAIVAALKAAKDLKEGQNVVVILPDSIRNYMTKFISEQWMEARGFKECVNTLNHWWWDDNVSKLNLQSPRTVLGSTTCEKLLKLMNENNVHQVPVVESNGGIVGIVTEQRLMTTLYSGRAQPSDTVNSIVVRIYPKAYKSASLGLISRILEKEPFVLILEETGSDTSKVDKPVAIVTAMDLLQYTSSKKA